MDTVLMDTTAMNTTGMVMLPGDACFLQLLWVNPYLLNTLFSELNNLLIFCTYLSVKGEDQTLTYSV